MNCWDANRTIPIAKDLEKKQGLFCRSRIESDLDTHIDAVFSKLYDLYDGSMKKIPGHPLRSGPKII